MHRLLSELLQISAKKQNDLVAMRRHLHQFPETGWNEEETSNFLKKEINNRGLQVNGPLATHGFYTEIKGDLPGPLICWRADMDALPIQDMKQVSYASKKAGFGHMCGHDVHSTIAVGIADLLKDFRKQIKGTIRIFWQPAEECNPSGAPVMIGDGVLEGAQAVYGMHCEPGLPAGVYGVKPREDTAAFDAFDVTLKTPFTAHSARPHLGRDLIWIATQILSQMYQLSGRVTDASHPTIITTCMFHAGEAVNVLPNELKFSGTARSARDMERMFLREKIGVIIQSMASVYDIEALVDFGKGAPSVFNNEKLYAFFTRLTKDVLGDARLTLREQSMGAEDFSFYSHERPGLFIRVGTGGTADTSHALHSNYFDVSEQVLSEICAYLSFVLIQHLETDPLK